MRRTRCHLLSSSHQYVSDDQMRGDEVRTPHGPSVPVHDPDATSSNSLAAIKGACSPPPRFEFRIHSLLSLARTLEHRSCPYILRVATFCDLGVRSCEDRAMNPCGALADSVGIRPSWPQNFHLGHRRDRRSDGNWPTCGPLHTSTPPRQVRNELASLCQAVFSAAEVQKPSLPSNSLYPLCRNRTQLTRMH